MLGILTSIFSAVMVSRAIVNLIDNCLEVYRDPRPDGTFGDVRTLRAGERVEVAALAGMTLEVVELLGG